MRTIQEIRNASRANGPATILAIGTANPPNEFCQAEHPDLYFRVTKSEHMTHLKQKFKHICERSRIKKRYILLSEEMLNQNPHMSDNNEPSLDTRQDILASEVPRLGKEASLKAIQEWGLPLSKITHVIFCTTSGVHMPGVDYRLAELLGLSPSVQRFMLYQLGCYAGGTVLRLAKDIAENNRGSRVLAVCCELISVMGFHGPHLDSLVGQAIFGDGAGAVIVGADLDESIERPIFELVYAAQTILPDSDGAIHGQLGQMGLAYHLRKDVPNLISNNIEKVLNDTFSKVIGVVDYNSIFWIAHPGGPAILDQVEAKLGLKQDKLSTTRHVLSEYGNMSSASVLFILDEMRKKSLKYGMDTTGEGLDWGVLFGFGPGLTVETIVLHSVPINK